MEINHSPGTQGKKSTQHLHLNMALLFSTSYFIWISCCEVTENPTAGVKGEQL